MQDEGSPPKQRRLSEPRPFSSRSFASSPLISEPRVGEPGTSRGGASSAPGLRELEATAVLGEGSFGLVLEVAHKASRRRFALKSLTKSAVVLGGCEAHVLRERVILQVSGGHPFVVSAFGFFQDAEQLYILMELLQGGSLYELLQAVGRLPTRDAAFFGACVASGLRHLHSLGVISRDVKPENLIRDDAGYVKLVDFGFGKVVEGKTYSFCGTPCYLAPEMVSGQGHDCAVDYWALGVLLYELLTGSPPFTGQTQVEILSKIVEGKRHVHFPPEMPDEARALIKKLLVASPAKRLGRLQRGARDVAEHPFFSEIDWHALLAREALPPHFPAVRNAPSDCDAALAEEWTCRLQAFERDEADDRFEGF